MTKYLYKFFTKSIPINFNSPTRHTKTARISLRAVSVMWNNAVGAF